MNAGCSLSCWPWRSETCNLPEEKLRPRLKRSYVSLAATCAHCSVSRFVSQHICVISGAGKMKYKVWEEWKPWRERNRAVKTLTTDGGEPTLAWNQALARGEHAEGAEGPRLCSVPGSKSDLHGDNMTNLDFTQQHIYIQMHLALVCRVYRLTFL